VATELKASLLGLYGRSCDEVADELALSNDYKLGEVIEQMMSGDTLVSFNYDTLAERLFQKRQNNNLMLRHCPSPPPPGVVRLVKPHGSVSWDLRSLGPNVTDGEPALTSFDDAAVLKGEVDPLLLGAVPIKSELIVEVQCCCRTPRVYDVIRDQWRAVAEAVRDAERLVVLGYSFPKEDSYGRFFLGEAVRERIEGLRVDIYDLRSRESEIKCSICQAFGGELPIKLQFRGEVTPAPPLAQVL
jgi:hypothetical protein